MHTHVYLYVCMCMSMCVNVAGKKKIHTSRRSCVRRASTRLLRSCSSQMLASDKNSHMSALNLKFGEFSRGLTFSKSCLPTFSKVSTILH